jgi:hypothetical protein
MVQTFRAGNQICIHEKEEFPEAAFLTPAGQQIAEPGVQRHLPDLGLFWPFFMRLEHVRQQPLKIL